MTLDERIAARNAEADQEREAANRGLRGILFGDVRKLLVILVCISFGVWFIWGAFYWPAEISREIELDPTGAAQERRVQTRSSWWGEVIVRSIHKAFGTTGVRVFFGGFGAAALFTAYMLYRAEWSLDDDED